MTHKIQMVIFYWSHSNFLFRRCVLGQHLDTQHVLRLWIFLAFKFRNKGLSWRPSRDTLKGFYQQAMCNRLVWPKPKTRGRMRQKQLRQSSVGNNGRAGAKPKRCTRDPIQANLQKLNCNGRCQLQGRVQVMKQSCLKNVLFSKHHLQFLHTWDPRAGRGWDRGVAGSS